MAEKALQKVEEQLNCSICLYTYTNPKLLQCFHVYCKECLVCLVARDQRGKLSLTCPNCRQATPVPDTGVSGLQSAFHIYHLLHGDSGRTQERNWTLPLLKQQKKVWLQELPYSSSPFTALSMSMRSLSCTVRLAAKSSATSVSVPSGASITAMITSQSVKPLRSSRKRSLLSWGLWGTS